MIKGFSLARTQLDGMPGIRGPAACRRRRHQLGTFRYSVAYMATWRGSGWRGIMSAVSRVYHRLLILDMDELGLDLKLGERKA